MRPICQMACYWPARDTREHVWWTSPLLCPRSLPHSLSSECGFENPRTTISSTSVDRSLLESPVLEARILWRRSGLNLDRPLQTPSPAPSLTLSPVSTTGDNQNHRPFSGGLLRLDPF